MLQTLRSHDQYNTTIYGLDDRYRGVKGGRRVVLQSDRHRDIRPERWHSGGLGFGFTDAKGNIQERRAKDFMVVAYSTPVGNAAAYYPETNALVALDHVAAKSNTPVSKAIVIRLEPSREAERSDGENPSGPGNGGAGPATSPLTILSRVRETLVVEEPLEIRVNGRPITVTMRTPGLGYRTGAGLSADRGRYRAPRRRADGAVLPRRQRGRCQLLQRARRDPGRMSPCPTST